MKLGILCTMINGFRRKGYYNSQEIGLGRVLAKKGHTVIIYKGVPKTELEETVKIEEQEMVHYIPMKHLGAHGFLDCRYLEKNLDGLFCFGDQQIFLPHVYRWCVKNGICFVPYVGTAHSLYSNLKSRVMNALFAAGTLRIYRKVPVAAKTETARKELESLGVRKVLNAPVGLDTAVLKQDFRETDKEALREKYGFSADDVILCNVSRLSFEKRPLELVDLFSRIRGKKPFRLIIVGDGEEKEALKEKIRSYGLEKEVRLYEQVPYEQMWEIYRISDYYLNMNQGEIFGMAVMEAVYYGVSVAAADAPGPRITLKGMKGHKICASDKEMEDWVLEPYPSEKDLKESAEKMAESFTWDTCANAFLRVIRGSKERKRRK